MLNKFFSFRDKIARDNLEHNRKTLDDIDTIKVLVGKFFAQSVAAANVLDDLCDAEFKVFSQWGDDGIIQYLISRLDIQKKNFVEFGVENYRESNTRFLLMNNNWSGLVMDGSEKNVEYIKNDSFYWKYDLTAVHAFVTAENVNKLLSSAGFFGEIGLLHIDIDGNDYWMWKAIDTVSPVIAIIEYNSLFGFERSITIPYDPQFYRFDAHESGIYAGASLAAICDLAESKGYVFIGSNSAGNNAYFIRKDKLGPLKQVLPRQGYVASKFREHRDSQGHLTFLSGSEALDTIRGMKVYNTRTGQVEEL